MSDAVLEGVSLAGALLMLGGSALILIAAIGIVRFPHLLTRMHAAAKPQNLGLVLLMSGLALQIRQPVVVWTLLLVVACQLVTAPIAAHMVGRAGFRTGRIDPEDLEVDELTEDLAAAARLSNDEVARRLAERGRRSED